MLEHIGLIITFVIVVIVCIIYTRLMRYRNRAREVRTDIEILMKQRWDSLPILIEIIKKYPIYEEANLEKIAKIEDKKYDELKTLQKLDVDKEISKVIKKIFDITKNSEDLNQDEEYIKLKENLLNIDKEMENNKKDYKSLSKEYNKKIETVPNNLIAILFGFNEEKFLETGK